MAEVNWSRRFDDPIPMPDGRIISTIGEAAEYATSLPANTGNTEPWQRAAWRAVRIHRADQLLPSGLWRYADTDRQPRGEEGTQVAFFPEAGEGSLGGSDDLTI
jgi:hypothetical protein